MIRPGRVSRHYWALVSPSLPTRWSAYRCSDSALARLWPESILASCRSFVPPAVLQLAPRGQTLLARLVINCLDTIVYWGDYLGKGNIADFGRSVTLGFGCLCDCVVKGLSEINHKKVIISSTYAIISV